MDDTEVSKADVEAVKRYCPNPDCPSQRRTRKGGTSRGRYVGEDNGTHGRHYCPECKVWYTWDGEKLVEVGTMALEDEL